MNNSQDMCEWLYHSSHLVWLAWSGLASENSFPCFLQPHRRVPIGATAADISSSWLHMVGKLALFVKHFFCSWTISPNEWLAVKNRWMQGATAQIVISHVIPVKILVRVSDLPLGQNQIRLPLLHEQAIQGKSLCVWISPLHPLT